MMSTDLYRSAAVMPAATGFAARPFAPTFTARVAARAACSSGFAAASVRESGLYIPAAKEKDTWMTGFLKDLAAVRTNTKGRERVPRRGCASARLSRRPCAA
jgi:hypothetical protein